MLHLCALISFSIPLRDDHEKLILYKKLYTPGLCYCIVNRATRLNRIVKNIIFRYDRYPLFAAVRNNNTT